MIKRVMEMSEKEEKERQRREVIQMQKTQLE